MIDTVHITNAAKLDDDTVTCLCGYSYIAHSIVGDPTEAIHVVWLADDGTSTGLRTTQADPNCEICLEKYPLVLLARTELE